MIHRWPIGVIVAIVVLALIAASVYFAPPPLVLPKDTEPYYRECTTTAREMARFIDALIKQDPSPCQSLSFDTICTAVVTKNPSLCSGNPLCLAMVNGNAAACGDDAECKAVITRDSSVCTHNGVRDRPAHQTCLGVASRTTTYLKSVEAESDCRDLILLENSKSAQDCSTITRNDVRQECSKRYR